MSAYERFTDRAREVIELANQEAQQLQHQYLGTEHILLGLILEESGVAATVLHEFGADLRRIRREIEKILGPGPISTLSGRRPQTPRVKRVIEGAIEEARRLGDDEIGPEHLLLGLLSEEEGVAAQALINLGLQLQGVRAAALRTLGRTPDAEPAPQVRTARRPAVECDLYLPLRYANGALIEPEKIADVKRRLHAQFGGMLSFPQRQEGVWKVADMVFHGEVVVLRVVTKPGGAFRTFFESLKEDLKVEIRQKDILILVRDVVIL